MFISRKRFEEMERKMEQLEEDVVELKNVHVYKKYYNQFACSNIQYGTYSHKNLNANTDLLGTVTLQDIASLLIDNKPIVRESEVKIKKEFRI